MVQNDLHEAHPTKENMFFDLTLMHICVFFSGGGGGFCLVLDIRGLHRIVPNAYMLQDL